MDQLTKRKLKMLVESEHWDAISMFVNQINKDWNNVPVKGDTEWETLWNVASKEAKIEGVREFIYSLERLAHED